MTFSLLLDNSFGNDNLVYVRNGEQPPSHFIEEKPAIMSVPVLLAAFGLGLLVWEVRSHIFINRALETGRLSRPWRRRRIIAFAIGALLVATSQWQQYSLRGGTAAGIPFFAVWHDAKGRDFAGAITVPAMAGNLAFWFLSPQVALACAARRHLRLNGESHPEKT